MAEDKKTPKEASELFFNVIKASVSPKATGSVTPKKEDKVKKDKPKPKTKKP